MSLQEDFFAKKKQSLIDKSDEKKITKLSVFFKKIIESSCCKIKLRNIFWDKENLDLLEKFLKKNEKIKFLEIESPYPHLIKPDDVERFFKIILLYSEVKKLNVFGNLAVLFNEKKAIDIFCKFLPFSNIEELAITGKIDLEDLMPLYKAIEKNKSIEKLYMDKLKLWLYTSFGVKTLVQIDMQKEFVYVDYTPLELFLAKSIFSRLEKEKKRLNNILITVNLLLELQNEKVVEKIFSFLAGRNNIPCSIAVFNEAFKVAHFTVVEFKEKSVTKKREINNVISLIKKNKIKSTNLFFKYNKPEPKKEGKFRKIINFIFK